MITVADTLIVIGMATAQLGTIREADGIQKHDFWLRNTGTEAVVLLQGYTSCGCTTIHFDRRQAVVPGDSTCVTLAFNPRGKGGDFEEVGTIVYGQQRKRLQLSLVGHCVTSEETLMRQFPVSISDRLRLSANRFDLGRMRVGESRERTVVVLHRGEQNRQETLTVHFTADAQHTGLQHIAYPLTVRDGNKDITLTIQLDVFVTF